MAVVGILGQTGGGAVKSASGGITTTGANNNIATYTVTGLGFKPCAINVTCVAMGAQVMAVCDKDYAVVGIYAITGGVAFTSAFVPSSDGFSVNVKHNVNYTAWTYNVVGT